MVVVEPRVELLSSSRDPLETIAMSAKLTHSENINFNIGYEEAEKMVKKMIELGHESTLEHASFTFLVICSRVCSHQLVRHRIGVSYSQRSERYVEFDDLGVIIPPDIAENKDFRESYMDHMRRSHELYEGLRARGIKKEDARFILPRVATKIMVSFNARSLRHFLKLRMDQSAQWEIRSIANQLAELVPEILVEDIRSENI